MTADRGGRIEAGIRERAYQLWLEEGRPHGRHDEHWRRAERELIEREMQLPRGSSTNAARHGETEHPLAAEPAGATHSRAKSQAPSRSKAKSRTVRFRQPAEGPATGAEAGASRRPALAKRAE
jgi:hypothetical protein